MPDKKVLWVTVADGDPDEMNRVAEDIQKALGNQYEVIVSDDNMELANKDEVLDALTDQNGG